MREASASLCAHALLANDKTVIQDARNDDRFHDNPRVTGPPGIRFHAGRPLAAPNGLTASTRNRANAAPAHSPGSAAANSRAVEHRRSCRRRRADRARHAGARAAQRGRRTRLCDPVQSRSRRIRSSAASYGRQPCSTQPIVTGPRTTSAARPPARERRRTARRYATTRATATAGVTATSAASRAQSAQPPSLSSHTAARSPSLPRSARASDRADGSRSTSDGRTDPPLAHSDRPRTCRRPAS